MLLFDENLSPKLTMLLREVFQGCMHVEDAGLASANDLELWKYAKKHGLSIITKDNDFNNLLRQKGFPPRVVWLRLGNCSTMQIANILTACQNEILDFLKDEKAGLLEIF